MKFPEVSIIDYGMGNIRSVSNAVSHLGANFKIINKSDQVISAESLILPGVGSFSKAINIIKENFFDKALIESAAKGIPILGICLGMQLLGISSSEGGFNQGISLFPNKVEKFSFPFTSDIKIPHIGFNSINFNDSITNKLFKNLENNLEFYFVHSYRMTKENLNSIYSTCNYGENFLSSIELNNVFGTQFHPEKSQTNGLEVLKNFLSI